VSRRSRQSVRSPLPSSPAYFNNSKSVGHVVTWLAGACAQLNARSIIFFHEKTLGSFEISGRKEIAVDLNRPWTFGALLKSLADLHWATEKCGKCVYEEVAAFTNPELKRHCIRPCADIYPG